MTHGRTPGKADPEKPTEAGRQPSGLQDEWENEGGSLRNPSDSDTPTGEDYGLPSAAALKLLDVLPSGILITNHNGQIIYANPACQHMCAMTEAEMCCGIHWSEVIYQQDRKTIDARHHDSWNTHEESFEARMINRMNQLVWIRHNISSLTPGQKDSSFIHTIEDISTIRLGQEKVAASIAALSSECERARVTLDCIGDAVISTDPEGRVSYMNSVAEQLTGWSRETAHGLPFSQIFRVIDTTSREPAVNPAQQAIDEARTVQLAANASLLRADGSELEIEDSAAPILDASNKPSGAVVVFRDRRFSQAHTTRMTYLARHDPLTGLANRVMLMERCEHALNLARRHDSMLAVLFIDLDNFKALNDSLGHKAGDQLLSMVARRLLACVRETDTVCRYGGDEFVILLNEIAKPEDAARVASKIQSAARKCRFYGHTIDLDLSIGISLYPRHGVDADSLLCQADAAMYRAKSDSKMYYCFFNDGMLRPASDGTCPDASNVINRTDRHVLHGR